MDGNFTEMAEHRFEGRFTLLCKPRVVSINEIASPKAELLQPVWFLEPRRCFFGF